MTAHDTSLSQSKNPGSNPANSTSRRSHPFSAEEGRLLGAVSRYLGHDDITGVRTALAFARELRENTVHPSPDATESGLTQSKADAEQDYVYVLGVAQTLAEALHIDAITLAAVLLYQLADAHVVELETVRERLGGAFGEQVAQTIESLERFDTLERSGAALRRSALTSGEGEELSRERRRSRERQRQQDADALRKMFLAMAEDPRVVVIKIADRLRLMRAVAAASAAWRAQGAEDGDADMPSSEMASTTTDDASDREVTPARWTPEEARLLAEETRAVFAPLAGRLGMGLVEGELEDLAFAVLEPAEYAWLKAAVAAEEQGRRAYVRRVSRMLRDEMAKIGINAKVSGRVKHLYSIYNKVQRSGSRDLSQLYDILAFRIIVGTVAECYLALGHVHELWRPKDGRIKDFIASPKPNGYQSLHTTVFCLDGQLAEIQIRTPEMHQVAEYGVAMHWYYKDAGDNASATARPLRLWMRQAQEWMRELRGRGHGSASPTAVEAVRSDVLREQIYVFTPAGDAKELPAGATPLDFAFRVHTDLGLHVAGARITTDDGSGRITKKLVPLDYELKNGDVVEIIKRADAHPTRDWLRVARTKSARDRILRYLKNHERDIDMQMGRERLDRELRAMGLRKGLDDLTEEDVTWLIRELGLPDMPSLLAALGSDKLRMPQVLPKVRERLKMLAPPEPVVAAETSIELPPAREDGVAASVEGMAGMLTRLATCCGPLPGDELRGFITRGRGVVIHRADCPNLRALLARQPGRGVTVDWPPLDGKETFRAPIVVEGSDRTGLLRDVTGLISDHKINMVKVDVVTRSRPERAVINAILEIKRPEELEGVLRDLRAVPSVLLAERKQLGGGGKPAPSARRGAPSKR